MAFIEMCVVAGVVMVTYKLVPTKLD